MACSSMNSATASSSFNNDDHGATGADLLDAAGEGRGDDVILILGADPDLIQIKDAVGDTAVHVVARGGHLDTLRQLIGFLQEQGEEYHQGLSWTVVEEKNADGDTPLHVAIKNGHVEVAMELFTAGRMMAWVRNGDGLSPRDLAEKGGYKELLEYMKRRRTLSEINNDLEKLSTLVKTEEDDDTTTLNNEVVAPLEDLPSRYEKALDNIRCICVRDSNTVKSQSLLADMEMELVRNDVFSSNEKEILQILAEDPTLVQRRGREGTTALHAAAMTGHVDMMKKLFGTTTELLGLVLDGDKHGNTALHLALYNDKLREGDKKGLIRYLVRVGPEAAYQMNKMGVSPLYLAVEKRYEEVVRYMFEAMPGETLSSLLRERLVEAKKAPVAHAAVKARNLGMLQVIMENLPSLINSFDRNGWRPLPYAAYKGYLEEVGYFISKFPDSVKKFDTDGSLPLHKAVGGGHVSVVKEFISCSPQTLYAVDKKGRSILHIAVRYGKADVLSYLTKETEVEKLFNLRDQEGKTFLDLVKELKC